MRTVLLAAVAMLAASGPGAGAVTASDCERHRDELVASLEANRIDSVRELDRAVAETDDADRKALLVHEREQAFEYEERMRATGDQVFRDCMAHVRERRPGG